MLYVVKIRREGVRLTEVMSALREWLDAQRFEPDAFRCTTEELGVACRLEFKFESEARACAAAFGGELISSGDHPSR